MLLANHLSNVTIVDVKKTAKYHYAKLIKRFSFKVKGSKTISGRWETRETKTGQESENHNDKCLIWVLQPALACKMYLRQLGKKWHGRQQMVEWSVTH